MLVKSWMSKTVITVDVNDSIQNAMKLLRLHEIRMLPVLENGKLVGVITDRDLKNAAPSSVHSLDIHELLNFVSTLKVKDFMHKLPLTVPCDYTMEETAEVLLTNKISGVPVVDRKGELVGIITQTDVFKVLISLTGVGKKGIQIAIKLVDRPKCIQEITDMIRNYGGRVSSILTSYERVSRGSRLVYIRIFDIDRPSFQRLLEEIKEKGEVLYIIDHDERKREIYNFTDQ